MSKIIKAGDLKKGDRVLIYGEEHTVGYGKLSIGFTNGQVIDLDPQDDVEVKS